MDHAGSLGGSGALLDGPAAGLLGAGSEVTLQAEGVVPDASEHVEAGLLDAHLGEEVAGLVLLHLDELRLELRVEEDGLRRGDEVAHPLLEVLVSQLVLIAVEHVEVRLGGEQVQFVELLGVDAGGAHALARFEGILGGLESLELRLHLLLDAGLLLHARDGLLDGG